MVGETVDGSSAAPASICGAVTFGRVAVALAAAGTPGEGARLLKGLDLGLEAPVGARAEPAGADVVGLIDTVPVDGGGAWAMQFAGSIQ